jgi:hypothetical protein
MYIALGLRMRDRMGHSERSRARSCCFLQGCFGSCRRSQSLLKPQCNKASERGTLPRRAVHPPAVPTGVALCCAPTFGASVWGNARSCPSSAATPGCVAPDSDSRATACSLYAGVNRRLVCFVISSLQVGIYLTAWFGIREQRRMRCARFCTTVAMGPAVGRCTEFLPLLPSRTIPLAARPGSVNLTPAPPAQA